MKKLNLFLAASTVFLIGCSQAQTTPGTSMESMHHSPPPRFEKADKQLSATEINAVLDEAEAERKKAAELSHEWRDTKKHIKVAKELIAKGELAEAQKLAEKARHEARMAVWQAGESALTWMVAVPQ